MKDLFNSDISEADQVSQRAEAIWAEYPNKRGKRLALTHIRHDLRTKRITFEELIARTRFYAQHHKTLSSCGSAPYGSTWFSQRRWDDEAFVDAMAKESGEEKRQREVLRQQHDEKREEEEKQKRLSEGRKRCLMWLKAVTVADSEEQRARKVDIVLSAALRRSPKPMQRQITSIPGWPSTPKQAMYNLWHRTAIMGLWRDADARAKVEGMLRVQING